MILCMVPTRRIALLSWRVLLALVVAWASTLVGGSTDSVLAKSGESVSGHGLTYYGECIPESVEDAPQMTFIGLSGSELGIALSQLENRSVQLVEMENCEVSSESWTALARISGLLRLRLASCTFTDANSALPPIPSLKTIELSDGASHEELTYWIRKQQPSSISCSVRQLCDLFEGDSIEWYPDVVSLHGVLDNKSLAILANACSQARTIDLVATRVLKVPGLRLDVSRFGNARELRLPYGTGADPDGVSGLSQLDHLARITFSGVDYLAFGVDGDTIPSNVTSIELVNCRQVSTSFVTEIPALQGLKSFKCVSPIAGITKMPPTLISYLSACLALEELRLDNIHGLETSHWRRLSELQGMRSLTIRNCRFFLYENVDNILATVEELELSGSIDCSISQLMSSLNPKILRSLSLRLPASSLTGDAVARLGQCNRLESLVLADMMCEDMANIPKPRFSSLKDLTVIDCTGGVDLIAWLPSNVLGQLTQAKIRDSGGSEDWFRLLCDMENLKMLDVSASSQFDLPEALSLLSLRIDLGRLNSSEARLFIHHLRRQMPGTRVDMVQ